MLGADNRLIKSKEDCKRAEEGDKGIIKGTRELLVQLDTCKTEKGHDRYLRPSGVGYLVCGYGGGNGRRRSLFEVGAEHMLITYDRDVRDISLTNKLAYTDRFAMV